MKLTYLKERNGRSAEYGVLAMPGCKHTDSHRHTGGFGVRREIARSVDEHLPSVHWSAGTLARVGLKKAKVPRAIGSRKMRAGLQTLEPGGDPMVIVTALVKLKPEQRRDIRLGVVPFSVPRKEAA